MDIGTKILIGAIEAAFQAGQREMWVDPVLFKRLCAAAEQIGLLRGAHRCRHRFVHICGVWVYPKDK